MVPVQRNRCVSENGTCIWGKLDGVQRLASEGMLPQLMKTEVELGTKVLLSCACCIPTCCLSWFCLHRYVERRLANMEDELKESMVRVVVGGGGGGLSSLEASSAGTRNALPGMGHNDGSSAAAGWDGGPLVKTSTGAPKR